MNSWIEIQPIPEPKGISRREAEGAAWRAIVRRHLGQDTVISYNENGAPVLGKIPVREYLSVEDRGPQTSASRRDAPNPLGYIGVSHTRGWVAVVWSPEPCAIDIEPADRKLSPAAAERYSLSSISDWCALEAAYKYKGLTGIEPPRNAVAFLPHPVLIVAVIR